MIEFTHVISDPEGLHARPVARICSAALPWSCEIAISCDGVSANAADPIELMGLMARRGDELTVMVDGADELACAEAMRAVFDF